MLKIEFTQAWSEGLKVGDEIGVVSRSTWGEHIAVHKVTRLTTHKIIDDKDRIFSKKTGHISPKLIDTSLAIPTPEFRERISFRKHVDALKFELHHFQDTCTKSYYKAPFNDEMVTTMLNQVKDMHKRFKDFTEGKS